ncbi:MAG TPA: DUF2934 domain-containing protein [Isosphaeraceae bacterium]|jgi:hypothetical protein|nr:DUF2934 domain-containing protein [Isosphaeraceae bacterium]
MSKHIPTEELPLKAPPHAGSSPVARPKAPADAPVEEDPAALGVNAAAEITPEQIAVRAYEIWLGNCKPDGTETQDWLEAERQLHAQRSNPQSVTTPIQPTR